MNWNSERDMAADIEANPEMYDALADGGDSDSDLEGAELAFPPECAECGAGLWVEDEMTDDDEACRLRLKYKPGGLRAYCPDHAPPDARLTFARYEARHVGGYSIDEWAEVILVGEVVGDD